MGYRLQHLALFLIYARVAHQGSRLSATRWSEDHAVNEILQVGRFDEEDLYAALDYLEQPLKMLCSPKPLHENVRDSLSSVSIPEWRYSHSQTFSLQDSPITLHDSIGIAANDLV